jgi:5-deoxy-glucuronate isomerase
MSLLVKGRREGREIANVTRATSGLKYVGFSAYRLQPGEQVTVPSGDREVCVVILSGRATVRTAGAEFKELGTRQSVFDDVPPVAVYAPGTAPIEIAAVQATEVAVCTAPGTGKLPPRLIAPDQMKRSVRGKGLNTRYVTDILPQDAPAESVLVVEVITPTGNSSSYPPHKHDRAAADETFLEETYYHRLDPPQGFVFQRVYTDERDLDESHAVEDHDVMVVPRGYHPVVVPWGYRSYYLNVMAGPDRAWRFHNDPAHEWILKKE